MRVVLVACDAGTERADAPALAQTVADTLGSEVFATNTQVSGHLNVRQRDDGRAAEWLRFSPRTASEAPGSREASSVQEDPSVRERLALTRRLRRELFPQGVDSTETDVEVRRRWAPLFARAHTDLSLLGEQERNQLLAEAGQIMAGRHQPPPIIRTDVVPSTGEATYLALFDDMAALIADRLRGEPRPGLPLEQQPAYVLSELLREEFHTQSTHGAAAGASAPAKTGTEAASQGESSKSAAATSVGAFVESVRRAVAPRALHVLDRPGLKRAVENVLAQRARTLGEGCGLPCVRAACAAPSRSRTGHIRQSSDPATPPPPQHPRSHSTDVCAMHVPEH
ncbi:hypothetical protein ABZT06_41925 [Streptomyces sp. NPDC005483]|uniref:hypothetical protein n=1 Tax=Streptomyces sp. NPDC005483 TaxID=3154882 RepID=UPI0033A9CC69